MTSQKTLSTMIRVPSASVLFVAVLTLLVFAAPGMQPSMAQLPTKSFTAGKTTLATVELQAGKATFTTST